MKWVDVDRRLGGWGEKREEEEERKDLGETWKQMERRVVERREEFRTRV